MEADAGWAALDEAWREAFRQAFRQAWEALTTGNIGVGAEALRPALSRVVPELHGGR